MDGETIALFQKTITEIAILSGVTLNSIDKSKQEIMRKFLWEMLVEIKDKCQEFLGVEHEQIGKIKHLMEQLSQEMDWEL